MAEGYARASGKPGVVLVTSGPGATNAVTGIADAFMDSIPLVVITGQVATPLIGTDAFQEADTIGITRHCTKHNYLVKDPVQLQATIAEAFRIATTGRPGPVLIDIPKDVQVAQASWDASGTPALPSSRYDPPSTAPIEAVLDTVEMLAAAEEIDQALDVATERLKQDTSDELFEEQQRLIAAQQGLRERLAQLAGTD